ncbi:hypothetical protein [Endozoicomonas sp.]|uniref:hypothetical protein n=1 Tax=Endozoicomonas sp. TaxID=1892382 RepID=UPI0028867E7B|nr:hypothetical protein [Endozoicomonas sp.]
MTQPISTNYPFHTLLQWNNQADKFVKNKQGNKIIILDNSTLDLKLSEQQTKADAQNLQQQKGKPLAGARARPTTTVDTTASIKKVLLDVRIAIEQPETADDFLRNPPNITSSIKIEGLDYPQLNSQSFLKIASPMLNSDAGIWNTLLDETKILRRIQPRPSGPEETKHLETIENLTKQLLSTPDLGLAEAQASTISRADTFNKKLEKELTEFHITTGKKKHDKSLKKTDKEIVDKIRDKTRQVIDNLTVPNSNSLNTDHRSKEPTPTVRKKKTTKSEKQPLADSSALPENDKLARYQDQPEPEVRVHVPKKNNPEKPENMESDNKSDITKFVNKVKEFIDTLPKIYNEKKANNDKHGVATDEIVDYTNKILHYGMNIPAESAYQLSQSLRKLFEDPKLRYPHKELGTLIGVLDAITSQTQSMGTEP